MKTLAEKLILPAAFVASLLLLMSASFAADDMITNSYNGYLSVFKQSEKSIEPILIIDAGHGGADGGAVGINGEKESEINLAIAQKTEKLAAFLGYDSIMTRNSENIEYPESCNTIRSKKQYDSAYRAELINSYKTPVVISIHQNKFDDPSVKGAQIFFRDTEQSKKLANIISAKCAHFVDKLRSAAKVSDDIYIFKKTSCTAILLECGYISNYIENELLNSENYQNKLAIAIIAGYNDYINDSKVVIGGTNEI